MSYAIKNDGSSWRAVNTSDDIDHETETFSEMQPVLVIPPTIDTDGFVQAIKERLGGVVEANSLAVSYPLFFAAIQSANWSDVQALTIDAQSKNVITSTQYAAIKSAASSFNIPITL